MTERSFLDVNFHSVVRKIMQREGIKKTDAYCLLDEDGTFIKFYAFPSGDMPKSFQHFEGHSIHSVFPPHLCSDMLFHIRMASREDELVSAIYKYKNQPEIIFRIVASFFRTPLFLDSKHIVAGFFLVLSIETPSSSKKNSPSLPVMPQKERFHLFRKKMMHDILSNNPTLHPNAQKVLHSFGITEATSLFVYFICEPLHEDPCIWYGIHSEDYLLSLYSWQNHAVEYLNREMKIFSWCYSEGIGILFPFVKESLACSEDESFQLGEYTLNALHSIFPRKKLVMGIGEKPCILPEIRLSLEQARKAAYGSLFGLRGTVFHYQDLGYGLLLNQKSPAEDTFMGDILEPLIPQEQEKPELLLTLEALLEKNSLAEAAQQIHVHINTMAYRKKQIEELLAVDLGDSRTRANLFFAVKLWKLRYIDKLHEIALNYRHPFFEDILKEDLFA